MGSLTIKNAANVEYALLLANTTPADIGAAAALTADQNYVTDIEKLILSEGVVTLTGLDNGGTPPLAGVVLQAKIDTLVAAGKTVIWLSIGSETPIPAGVLTGTSVTTSTGELTGVGAGVAAGALTGVGVTTSTGELSGAGAGSPAALIPALTGYTGTGVTVSAKTEDTGGTTQAWKAFDSSSSTFYAGASEGVGLAPNRSWLKVIFDNAKTITELQTTNIATNNLGYNAAVLEYSDTPSNDDISAWTTALSITGANVTTLRTYTCTEPTAHTGWRLRYVSQLDGASSFTYQLQQMQLIGY